MEKFCQIRILAPHDAESFVRLRMELFIELGEIKGDSDALSAATRQYFLAETGKNLLTWGVFAEEELVSCASLCLFTRLPYAGNLSGLEAYLLNVYTAPAFRHRGYASKLLQRILVEAPKRGIGRLWLNASSQGRPLYEASGFRKIEDGMEWFPLDFV